MEPVPEKVKRKTLKDIKKEDKAMAKAKALKLRRKLPKRKEAPFGGPLSAVCHSGLDPESSVLLTWLWTHDTKSGLPTFGELL